MLFTFSNNNLDNIKGFPVRNLSSNTYTYTYIYNALKHTKLESHYFECT